MKIAILTQPLGSNYGGIIQAFALQHTLKDMGHDVVTIDRRKPNLHILERALFYVSRFFKKVLGKRKAPIFIESHYPIMFKNTRDFVAKYINTSNELTSTLDMKTYFEQEKFDMVVVGSDQVWRYEYSPNIKNFFFDFLEGQKIKRISYAASFGNTNWVLNEQITSECSRLAKLFDAVSVREKDAVELCHEKLGVDATWVCDPTLLISKTRYQALIENASPKIHIKGELFYYLLSKNRSLRNTVRDISKSLSLQEFTCYPKRNHHDVDGSDMNEYVFPPLEQWLASFDNANLIVTDSFHGVVFSLIFGKPFLVFINEARGASRFHSLMKIADFRNRIISENTNIDELLKAEWLFEKVSLNKSFIDQSRKFLTEQLQ